MLSVNYTKKLASLLAISIMLILSASCATGPPSQDELNKADYGTSLSQDAAVKMAERFLRNHLKDPGSAIYEWGQVNIGWVREAPIYGGGLKFGYVLDGSINAKNSFGGYAGFKQYKFLFYNSNISSVYAEQELRMQYTGTSYMGKIY